MPGPLTEDRLNQLKDDAAKLLEVFGKEYLKSFGVATLLKIKTELEGEESDIRKLHYRDWDTVERPELFSGFCYMKAGAGPGDFGKWKKYFIVERQDYSIDLFASDKDHEKGKKPKKTISVCGYHLETDVSWFYRREMKSLCEGMGITDAELEVMTSFSEFSWAMVHPWRTNYVFQLHKGKDPFCPCFGGNVVEPEGTGSEFAGDRDDFLEVFERCVAKASARDTEEVIGQAFQMTCEKMRSKLDRLWWWEDDGKECEMLTDALLLQCLAPLRDEMLADLKGPSSIKMVSWFKTRGVMYTTLEKMADPAWSAVQTTAKKVGEKIEPVLKKGLEPIFAVKAKAKAKIQSSVTDKMGSVLGKHVTPYIDPIFKALDTPLNKGHLAAKEVFDKHVVVSKIPSDAKQMRLHLDTIPRTSENLKPIRTAVLEVLDPLKVLRQLNEDIFGSIDVLGLRSKLEGNVLSTLDAAIFKLENQIEEQGSGGAEDLKQKVLQDYNHDIVVARATFVKEIVRFLLLGNFKRITKEITSPVIDSLNNVIPEDMQDFLDLEAMLDEIIDLFVGEPIDKMVDAAYPLPK